MSSIKLVMQQISTNKSFDINLRGSGKKTRDASQNWLNSGLPCNSGRKIT